MDSRRLGLVGAFHICRGKDRWVSGDHNIVGNSRGYTNVSAIFYRCKKASWQLCQGVFFGNFQTGSLRHNYGRLDGIGGTIEHSALVETPARIGGYIRNIDIRAAPSPI